MRLLQATSLLTTLTLTSAFPNPNPNAIPIPAYAPHLSARGEPIITTVTSFLLSTSFSNCSASLNPETVTVSIGQACGICKPTSVPPLIQSISVTQLEPKCRVTVYKTADCSDPGIVSGTAGCWSPEGGILAYRVDCPWYFPDVNAGEPRACTWNDPDDGEGGEGGDSCTTATQ